MEKGKEEGKVLVTAWEIRNDVEYHLERWRAMNTVLSVLRKSGDTYKQEIKILEDIQKEHDEKYNALLAVLKSMSIEVDEKLFKD